MRTIEQKIKQDCISISYKGGGGSMNSAALLAAGGVSANQLRYELFDATAATVSDFDAVSTASAPNNRSYKIYSNRSISNSNKDESLNEICTTMNTNAFVLNWVEEEKRLQKYR